jgi:hypothetical protein
MKIDKRKWTMTVEVVGVFRGPLDPRDGHRSEVEDAAVQQMVHRALVKMEAAANNAGGYDMSTEDILADCCLRLHFRDPKNMRRE